MNLKAFVPATALVIGLLGLEQLPAQAQSGGILFKAQMPGTNYCHLKFPEICEETLFSAKPELTDPSEGNIIDFYGPCDHDPLGKSEIKSQRADVRRDRRGDTDND